MSLLGSIGTNLALGAAQQINDNYTNTQNERDFMIKQRKAVIDKVAATQDTMDKQASDIANTSNSYKQTYGINDDQAYALATNPEVKKMKPDELADFIQRMKPTNQYTKPTGPTTIRQAAPGVSVDRGILGGGGYDLPPVPGVTAAAQPSRQTYSVNPPQPKWKDTMGPLTATDDPVALKARSDLATWENRNPGQMPPQQMVMDAWGKTGSGSASDKTLRREIMTTVFNEVSNNNLPVDAVGNRIKTLGGDPSWASSMDWNAIDPKRKSDPVIQQKVDMYMPLVGSSFPELGPQDQRMVAGLMASGGIKIEYDQINHQPIAFNGLTGEQLDKQMEMQLFNGMHAQAVQKGDLPKDSPLPYPNLGAPSNTQSIPQDAPIIPKFTPGMNGMPSEEYKKTHERIMEIPKLDENFDRVIKDVQKHPDAVGLIGEIINHFGGPVVNVADLINKQYGAQLDQTIGVSEKQALAADLTALHASMQRYQMGLYSPTNSPGGMGGLGHELADEFNQVFSHGDIHMVPGGVIGGLQKIQTTLRINTVHDLQQIVNFEPDLATNQAAQRGTLQFLTTGSKGQPGLGFTKTTAFRMLHYMEQLQQGNSAQ